MLQSNIFEVIICYIRSCQVDIINEECNEHPENGMNVIRSFPAVAFENI